jgi:YD repeat-containing protein
MLADRFGGYRRLLGLLTGVGLSLAGAPASGASTTYASGTCGSSGTSICYAPQGAVQSLSLYNGVSENWTFNPLLQPGELTAKLGSTTLMDLTWSYNVGTGSTPGTDNGNVVSQTIARTIPVAGGSPVTYNFSQSFGYVDPANRLASANEGSAWSQTYGYDAFGNRAVTDGVWNQNGVTGATMPNPGYTPQHGSEFNSQNQWVRGTARASCTTPDGSGLSVDKYDCAGNQISLAQADGVYTTPASTFSYDGENRLLANRATGDSNQFHQFRGRSLRSRQPAVVLTATLGTAAPTTSLAWTCNTGADNSQTVARTIPVAGGGPVTYNFSQSYGYADPANRLLSAGDNRSPTSSRA